MVVSVPQLSIQTFQNTFDMFSDSRKHGYQGPSRNVRLGRVTPPGGGSIAKSEDGIRCAVTGKESLRILRMSDPSQSSNVEHKFAIGKGGHRIDASRNFWDGSGLKIDSASTDVAWGQGLFNNKILTSARNGELIMWDLNKSGVTKYERRTKDHIRSIHKISVSQVVHHYCITGSADGHMRVWDLRDMSKSIMRVHHPTSVRSLVFSPSFWQPLQSVVGLDNGSICRWDLRMGQRGQLDKLPVAHSASVTTLDWCSAGGVGSQHSVTTGVGGQAEMTGNNHGWLVSGGLDRCVKVWDLTSPGANTHIPHKATYTLHPSFPVRRIAWRPGYECELAVISNTEYSTATVDSSPSSANGPAIGALPLTGSGVGLDTLLRPDNYYVGKDKLGAPAVAETKIPSALSSVGDSVEIWDVRRGWLAKWSVNKSAVEGGVTDIAFGDSHALWAQHATGSFSQFDLRAVTKPIDSMPRVAATWEVSGSVTFVADANDRWEIPYDDIPPDQRSSVELRKPAAKALGDPSTRIKTQSVGTYTPDFMANDLETFSALARGYIFEGHSCKDICAYNSGVALMAGHEAASQVWLLLGASLAQYVPDYPPTPPLSPPPPSKQALSPLMTQNPPQPTPVSGYSFPPSLSNKTTDSANSGHKTSPGRRSTTESLSRISSHSSTSRRLTPTSSTSSSPRHLPISLPLGTPLKSSPFGRRESVDSGVFANSALLRRPSLPAPPLQSSSPGDRSTPSLRHVGEGVLDDSDSSGSEEEEAGDGEETANANTSDEEIDLRPLPSPILTGARMIPAGPSPLSRIASHQVWTEDEDDPARDDDDASSPSPQSSETDSNSSGSPDTISRSAKARHRNSTQMRTRSRSSTVASLAAPQPRPLTHHQSHSSIRTITAAETSLNHDDIQGVEIPPNHQHSHPAHSGHSRQKSQAISELALNNSKPTPLILNEPEAEQRLDEAHLTERRIDIIQMEERKFRDTTLEALRSALEEFADEGDVQMCAMLALVAPEELQISQTRVTRFLDSYIEIRKTTLLETTIYTSCGKCRKPLILPAGSFSSKSINKGAFSYCLGCKASCVMCSICRLPVRALLFQCSVCNHGGHQSCYRQYYLEQPMIDLPTLFLPLSHHARGRPSSRMPPSNPLDDDAMSTSSMAASVSDALSTQSDAASAISLPTSMADTLATQSPVRVNTMKLAGHPCAAGCGHHCWAANIYDDDL
ncbi:hypothetical protein M413DRAFT_441521 [Hebeloma cylindrosporum]|uniref:Uncharacterized protein n=1 Tax=Hebeloma cylindrosporum TaxID=76867 RepID=A0A0C2Y9A2_HEBCY|nr:hypothetical protein M413DRAFT_441521 [Hebeloma cylindrosporum h7]